MTGSVATIVVAHSANEYLAETLSQLSKQNHSIQQVMVVDTASDEETAQIVSRFGFSMIQPSNLGLGAAIDAGVAALSHEPNWLWILHDDSAPEPNALAALSRRAETSPSVAIVGPKLLRWEMPIEIQQMGITVTKTGRPFLLVESEFDQGQFDVTTDTLAVSTAGMLVSLPIWRQLGGIDDRSPLFAQDIEFAIKARAAGYRVVVEASARVLHAGLSFSQKRTRSWLRGSYRQALAKAHIHLATVLLPAPLVPLLYLLLPVAAIGLIPFNLIAKKPTRIFGQLTAWLWAWATFPARIRARQSVRKFGSLSSLSSLFASWREVRSKRNKDFEFPAEPLVRRKGFFQSGAFYISLLIPLLALGQFPSGALKSASFPIGRNFQSIWENTGTVGVSYLEGFPFPADPFNWFFALVALLPASPSVGLSWFVFLALSLSFISAWLLMGLLTDRAWLRSFAALGYALSPPLLSMQSSGDVVGLVVAVFLPLTLYFVWQNYQAFNSARSWRWGALAGLSAALIAISNPLIFALAIVFAVGLGLARIGKLLPLLLTAIPGSVLLLPWFMTIWPRLDLFVQTSSARFDSGDFAFWPAIALAVAVLIASIAGRLGLALASALFAALAMAAGNLLGFDSSELPALLTLLAVALLVAALDATQRKSILVPGSLFAIAGIAASTFFYGVNVERLRQTDDLAAPALVVAQADVASETRTLVLTFDDKVAADLVWGDGRSVDERSVLYRFVANESIIANDLAELTGQLVAANSESVDQLLSKLGINFVIVQGNEAQALSTKAALASMPYFQISGDSAFGSLFRVTIEVSNANYERSADRTVPLSILAAHLLLAIPTPATIRGYRRRGRK